MTAVWVAGDSCACLSPLLCGFQKLQHLTPRIGVGIGLRRAALAIQHAVKTFGLEADDMRRSWPKRQQNEMTGVLVFQMPERKFKTVRLETTHHNVGKHR